MPQIYWAKDKEKESDHKKETNEDSSECWMAIEEKRRTRDKGKGQGIK